MLYTLAITTGSAIFQEPGAQRGVRTCAERERDVRAPWSARERVDRGRRATASCARGCALAVAHAMAVGVQAVGAEASSTKVKLLQFALATSKIVNKSSPQTS